MSCCIYDIIGTFDVQDCDVSSDQHTSSILVECTFAINSTAPGIVVIQDDQSQYTINKTLQRLLQDSDKGSVNITGLPAGEYSVRVYDNSPATDSTSAAYQQFSVIGIDSAFKRDKFTYYPLYFRYFTLYRYYNYLLLIFYNSYFYSS